MAEHKGSGLDLRKLTASQLRTREREAEEACTDRQVRFVRNHVLEGMNQTEAFKAAGYQAKEPERQASRNMRNPKVVELTSVYMEVLRRTALLSADNLQIAAAEVLERAMLDDDRATALRAIDQLTKMRGQYAPTKQEVSVKEERAMPAMDQATLREMFKAQRLRAVEKD